MRMPKLRECCPLLLVCLVAAGCGSGSSPLAPSNDSAETTFLSIRSDPTDYVLQGKTLNLDLANARWRANVAVTSSRPWQVTIDAELTGVVDWWSLRFVSPEGVPLEPGLYTSATSESARGSDPRMQVSGAFGKYCSVTGAGIQSTGRFRVIEIVVGPGDTLSRFHATFEQSCVGTIGALRGEVRYLAP